METRAHWRHPLRLRQRTLSDLFKNALANFRKKIHRYFYFGPKAEPPA